MKLDYKILWLDDKMDVILDGEYDSEVENFLLEEGFNPIIVTVKNEEEFFNNLDDSYDLIMTDYHLNEKEGTTRDGDVIIKEVREKNSIFTEIMFYSAQGEVVDTVKLDRITFVDTRKIVGTDHYEKLIGKALTLIKLTIKKFQHIVAMRGMIMSETSGLDVEIEDILNKIIIKGNSVDIVKVIKDKFLETNYEFSERVEKCKDVPELLNYIGADHRVRSILRNIDKGAIKDVLSDYTKQIIVVRNQFAHAVLENETNTFRTRNGIVFNDQECVNIRKNINRHIKNLKDLQLLIN
ncbi:MAG: hypothetical protein Q8R22_13035 [Flavobacterium sp.]|uniref:hypothetical protein n=1 Tax=Flavobacterium sp. TaxID=239 RepID=UPI002732F4A7|nr:hypothetical protein [Flavobacterium sp.]MDP3681748.1 hypothetical protein [Flavobacterium sp.]